MNVSVTLALLSLLDLVEIFAVGRRVSDFEFNSIVVFEWIMPRSVKFIIEKKKSLIMRRSPIFNSI